MKNKPELTILIIDDSPEDRESIKRFLSKSHVDTYQFLEAETGEDGFGILNGHRPDCVLLDYQLPDTDGISFIRDMVTKQGLNSIPIILLTGQGDESIATDSLKSGAQDYLIKGNMNSEILMRSVRYAVERKQAEITLKENEEKFRTLANNIPGVVYRCDNGPGWTMKFISNSVMDLTGYPSTDFINNRVRTFASLIHPEDIEMVKSIIDKMVNQRKPYIIEYRVIHATGDIRWVYERGQGVFNEAGELLWLDGIVIDNTEQKIMKEKIRTSLEEKEILLKEIHHRVKNNMSVISSMLRLSSENIEDKHHLSIFKECENRVKSMALIHEELYQAENLAEVDFAEYTKALSSRILKSYEIYADKISLSINVDNVFLGVNKAIPLGLILNELLSNTIKYAFPEDKKGELIINMRRIEEAKSDIEFVFSDNGVGLPEDLDFRNTKSLGMNLVNGLTNQIKGTIEYDNSNGAKFTIVFKV